VAHATPGRGRWRRGGNGESEAQSEGCVPGRDDEPRRGEPRRGEGGARSSREGPWRSKVGRGETWRRGLGEAGPGAGVRCVFVYVYVCPRAHFPWYRWYLGVDLLVCRCYETQLNLKPCTERLEIGCLSHTSKFSSAARAVG